MRACLTYAGTAKVKSFPDYQLGTWVLILSRCVGVFVHSTLSRITWAISVFYLEGRGDSFFLCVCACVWHACTCLHADTCRCPNLCVLFFRLLEMQKLHITIIQVGLGSSFRWTTRRMAWFMGKYAGNYINLSTSLLWVGAMFIVSDATWDIVIWNHEWSVNHMR